MYDIDCMIREEQKDMSHEQICDMLPQMNPIGVSRACQRLQCAGLLSYNRSKKLWQHHTRDLF